MTTKWLLGLLLALTVPTPLWGQAGGTGDLETYELANGLKVILSPDPTATAVAVNMWYDAGSRREPPGRSGFGHLFEHLMFQGSQNLEPGAHSSLVLRAGGTYNAYINVDNTGFFQTLPPDRYNLGLWLEAERMRSLEITEENMRREIEVVKEERRLSVENAPYGEARMQSWFYVPYDPSSCFSYAHSIIGSAADLDASTLDDVQNFFDVYYVPNNATLTLAGSFEPSQARALIQQYFGGIPRSADPPPVTCETPFRTLPARIALDDPNARLPAVLYSYGTVPASHPDADALNLLVSILTDGQSSRFFQRLVREEQLALQASGFTWERLGPGLISIVTVANQGVDPSQLELLLDEVIEEVQRDGVAQAELDKARNSYLASTVRERQTVNGTAEAIQWANLFLGDPRATQTRLNRLMTITVADLQRVANTYLTPENRAVVIATPVAGGGN